MKTVHKHKVSLDKEWHTLDLPVGSEVVHVDYLMQEKAVFLWAEVKASMDPETRPRQFRVFCTGDGVPASTKYIGTAIDQHGPEAYHLYESLDKISV